MGSDFNSCRFDFRLDANTGLRPSRRRGRHRAASTTSARATPRDGHADNGGRCSTLYSCKICGCLLCSRSDRKAHVLTHKQTSRANHTSRSQPISSSSPDLDHLPLMSTSADQSQAEHPQLDCQRMSFRLTHATELVLPSSTDVPQTSSHVLVREATPAITSSSLCFRSLNDVVDSAISNHTYSNNFMETNSSNDVLDLTTKTTADEQSPLPVISTSDASSSDFRSLVVRQRKSRCLDVTIQKLWQFKLQQHSACATDDVTSDDLGRTRSRDNGDDLVNNTVSLGQTEEQPSCEVTGSRSLFGGEGRVESKLKLRRLVAAPSDEQPLFYTSLMTLQSPTRRKTLHAVQRRIIRQPTSNLSALTAHSSALYHPGVMCHVCEYVAGDADDLRSHLLATHGHEIEEFRATHSCTKCGRRFTYKANLAYHINSMRHHAGMTSRRRNAHLSLRHRRLQLSHGTKSSTQTVERRSRGSTMTSLQETGSGVESAAGRVTCEFPGCRRVFGELKHLKVHRMQHTDERPLSCAICTYSCRQRNSLNWHMKSRHGLSKSVTEDGRTVYISESS